MTKDQIPARPTKPDPEDLLTVAVVAVILGVTTAAAYRYVRTMRHVNLCGARNAGQPGGRLRVRRSDLEAWMARRTHDPFDPRTQSDAVMESWDVMSPGVDTMTTDSPVPLVCVSEAIETDQQTREQSKETLPGDREREA